MGADKGAAETQQTAVSQGAVSAEAAFDNALNAFLAPVTPAETPADAGESTGDDLSNQNHSQQVPEEQPQSHGDTEAASEGEPEPEPEEAPESEQPADAPVEPVEAEVTPAKPDPFEKRIGKEVAKRKALEEKVAALEAKLSGQAEAKEVAPGLGNQGAPVDFTETDPDVHKLAAEVRNHEANRALARTLTKQLRTEPEKVEAALRAAGAPITDWSDDGMRDYLETVHAETVAQSAAAQAQLSVKREQAKARVEQERTRFETLARKQFPQLADEDSELSQLVAQAFKSRPWLKADPAGLYQAAAAGASLLSMRAAKPAAAGKAAKAALPKMPPVNATAPAASRQAKAPDRLAEVAAAAASDSEERDRAIGNFFRSW